MTQATAASTGTGPAADDEAATALRAQCLATGQAGAALLPIEQARDGTGTWPHARAAITAITRYPVAAGPASSLYLGAPAVAFTLHTADRGSGRYTGALRLLDERTAAITSRRLRDAADRISARQRPLTSEYDLFYGLTGLGLLQLARDPASPLLEDILAYLVRLTRPLPGEHGQVPGWWTPRDPCGQVSAAFPGGHLNLGMAHGIAGPLALMSAAARRGITITGQHEAIATICAILDAWRQDSPAGLWWPQWITLPEYAAGHSVQPGPGRPSWCYGTPGLARAQQLAGDALADPARQSLAEHALLSCLNDPASLARITDASLCHGTAGLLLTTHHAARDAPPGTFTSALRRLRALHQQLASPPGIGLLEGGTGTALATRCDTTAGRTASGWDACILPT